MSVDTVTGILAPGALDISVNREHDSAIDIGFEEVFQDLETPLVVATEGGGSQLVDIGGMVQPVLHATCATAGDRQLNRWINRIEPDFVFSTIQRRNCLHLKINVTIAGETMTVDFKKAMAVLAQA